VHDRLRKYSFLYRNTAITSASDTPSAETDIRRFGSYLHRRRSFMFRKLRDCKSRRTDICIERNKNKFRVPDTQIYLSSSGTQIHFCATTRVLTLFIDAVITCIGYIIIDAVGVSQHPWHLYEEIKRSANDSNFNVMLTFWPPSYFMWKHAQPAVIGT